SARRSPRPRRWPPPSTRDRSSYADRFLPDGTRVPTDCAFPWSWPWLAPSYTTLTRATDDEQQTDDAASELPAGNTGRMRKNNGMMGSVVDPARPRVKRDRRPHGHPPGPAAAPRAARWPRQSTRRRYWSRHRSAPGNGRGCTPG